MSRGRVFKSAGAADPALSLESKDCTLTWPNALAAARRQKTETATIGRTVPMMVLAPESPSGLGRGRMPEGRNAPARVNPRGRLTASVADPVNPARHVVGHEQRAVLELGDVIG